MIVAQRLAVNEPAVVSETIDGEVVVINLDRGSYYSLRNSAAFLWGLVQDGMETHGLTAAVLRRYEGDESHIRASTQSFLTQLVDEQLLKPATSDYPGVAPAAGEVDFPGRTPFVAPALEKYTDMEHLLLLDPIHDVDESGWPQAR